MAAPFAPALLDYFARHRADLPWRRDPSPYQVWLAEIMLQQTQVAAVIPYYLRFIAAFPELAALAAADLDAVLKQWEGLGYYSRARHLHQCARLIVEQHGGHFPRRPAELQTLPGIGPYTAGAIASIAFGAAVPVVDGNIIRILTRLLDIDDDVGLAATRRKLWEIAADWVPAQQPGDYNQALMELGQTVCRPRNPHCGGCPLQNFCRAYANGTQAQRPVKSKRAPLPHYDVSAGLIRDARGRLLIAQRPLKGLLGGLWEFPGGKREKGESLPECLTRELREELAIEVAVGECFVVVRHAFTHFKITLHAFECRYLGALPPHSEPQAIEADAWAWVDEAGLDRYPFGRADREVIAALRARHSQLL